MDEKITPYLESFSLYVVLIDTLSKTASTATFANCFCSDNGIPNLLKTSKTSGFISSKEENDFRWEYRFDYWPRKMIDGWSSRAAAKRARTSFSPSPTYEQPKNLNEKNRNQG